MRKTLFIALLLFPFALLAQNAAITVYTDHLPSFKVYLNGELQNADAQQVVKCFALQHASYKVRVVFDKPGMAEIRKNIFPEEGQVQTFELLADKKKGTRMRLASMAAYVPDAPVGTIVMPVAPPAPNGEPAPTTTIINQTTINNTIAVNSQGVGNTVNVVTENQQKSEQELRQDEIHGSPAGDHRGDGHGRGEGERDRDEMPGYHGKYGCHHPMHPQDFDRAMQSISSKKFDDTRLTIAKQVVEANCLTANQVKQLLQLFTFEQNKLEMAKFAYRHTIDQDNYFLLNDAFTFESTIDELVGYIKSQH